MTICKNTHTPSHIKEKQIKNGGWFFLFSEPETLKKSRIYAGMIKKFKNRHTNGAIYSLFNEHHCQVF